MEKELKVWLNVNPHKDRHQAKQYSDAILQNLLRQYQPNASVFQIERNENGKPFVKHGPHFSYAHCGHLYAYVLDDEPIGIDVERINPKRNFKGVAQRHYHDSEWQEMQNLAEEEQKALFFRWWAQKEAWCKHQGGVLWYYLPQEIKDSGLHFFDVFLIKGMACSLATKRPISQVFLNVVK